MPTTTQKQWDFAVSLGQELRQLAGNDPDRTAVVDTIAHAVKRATVDRAAMSTHIDAMIDLRNDWRQDAPADPARDESELEGVHLLDGEFVKVQLNREGTRHYAKQWDQDTESWDYVGRKLLPRLSQDTKLDAEQAARFGHLYGQCVYCSSVLTDERSIAVGYGPICASNHGLPWGEPSSPAGEPLVIRSLADTEVLGTTGEAMKSVGCQHTNRTTCVDGCCWQCPDCGEAS